MVVVDDWREAANATSLRRWHRELSPLFAAAGEGGSGDALRAKLTVEYWLGVVKAKQRSLRRAAGLDARGQVPPQQRHDHDHDHDHSHDHGHSHGHEHSHSHSHSPLF